MQTALSYRTNRDLFSNYYLNEHLPETEAWDELDDAELREAKDDIMELWEQEKDTAPKRNESQLEEKFIRPMFRKLGIPFEVEESTDRTQKRPDYGFFETEEDARHAFDRREKGGDFYEDAVAVADAKQWGRPLDTRGSGEHKRDFENPSYQIHVYLQETSTRWAVLTDGKKWRLYYDPTSHRLDSYYEIDLPTVIEQGDLEAFKYFYLFFRHEAFLEDSIGESFLDEVYHESNVFARELGEDLQDNIYDAIKVISEGFLQYSDNDLTADDLDLIHDSSLIYLYRLIFVLYSESEGRDLLDTNNDIYEESYSLNTLKEKVAEELDSPNPKYRDWQTNLWDRLDELFKLIDQGSKSRDIPEEDLYIPAYNGGLFRTDPDEDDSVEARFLANQKVGDAYLAEVIELLTRSQNGNSGGKIFVDYSSLDVRHLGSIYEGLLEYQLNVAEEPLALEDGEYVPAGEDDEVIVKKGEVHLSTGSGERKATGSYYTPEYVVEYIVEETVGPLVDDIRSSLVGQSAFYEGGFAEEFAEEVFDLKILDPAMGSGHFLTSAIDYLAREIIDAQERQAAQQGIETVDEEHDINWARRQVAQKCVYGVDVNPLAVELSKVSMWLRTLAADQPLAFLDHHLKAGNSLIGTDIEEIDELDTDLDNRDQNQSTLAQYGAVRRGTMEQMMDVYEEFIAIENRDRTDVKEMERKYRQIEQNELRNRLVAIANIHTAEAYGVDVPGGAYELMAKALDDDAEWADVKDTYWFKEAQALAEKKNCLHWKLEFPEVFYDEDGNGLEKPGFDVVLGNPPYVRIYRGALPEDDVEYWRDRFDAAHMKFDLYTVFMEISIDLTRQNGYTSMIVPDAWMSTPYGEPLRSQILDETCIKSILDLRDRSVFSEVTVSNVIPVLRKGNHGDDPFPVQEMHEGGAAVEVYNRLSKEIIRSTEDNSVRLSMSADDVLLTERIEERSVRFDDIYYANWGLRTGTKEKTDKYVVESTPDTEEVDAPVHPMIRGKDIIDRYKLAEPSEYIIYQKDDLYNPMFEELFESDKLVFRKISGEGLMAIVDEKARYCFSTLIPATNISNVAHVNRSGIPDETDTCRKYTDLYYALALVNSTLMDWYYQTNLSDDLSVVPGHIQQLPIAEINFESGGEKSVEDVMGWDGVKFDEKSQDELLGRIREQTDAGNEKFVHDLLSQIARQISKYNRELVVLDLNLLDYLGKYEEGPMLSDVGLFNPKGSTILDATTQEFEKLRVGDVKTERDGRRVTIYAKARYKPENEDEYETDQWGYSETDYYEAFALTDLSEKEAVLVKAFVPVAVEKADGFAGFRDSATKTNSPIDRLKAIRLPEPDDVADDLRRYMEVKQRADKLDEKIDKTDRIIDEIVYHLYELTEEEIEIVESAVQDD